MKTVPMAFTYIYGLRMRPNAFPKPRYEGILLIDMDAAFTAEFIAVILEGREDEQPEILERYSLQLGTEKPQRITEHPPRIDLLRRTRILFQPGEMVRIVLSREIKPKPTKLRSCRLAGEGINVLVILHGVKHITVPGSASAALSAEWTEAECSANKKRFNSATTPSTEPASRALRAPQRPS